MRVVVFSAVLTALLAGLAAAQQTQLLAPLNTGVNALLQAAGAPNRLAAKVVPIVTAGGVSAGLAQITGPPASLAATRAVLEVRSQFGGLWAVRALIPVTRIGRDGTIRREYDVGVDAVIDMRP